MINITRHKMINTKIWEPVINESQIKNDSVLKIVGFSSKDSYKRITVKKVLNMEGRDGREWVEILINKKKNYFFNLSAYLGKEKTWGKWVSELYVRKPTS